ncbi:hypothetical protein PIB30_088861 [Stylosanthes scabra]|uniref:Uncharacterized protein n=1 Tax=Stylosanthes scabra TaxID=79078 RepID=A0ABU6RUS2_9FABA|nr:hypothetical protein [Stylosanthes scabra]
MNYTLFLVRVATGNEEVARNGAHARSGVQAGPFCLLLLPNDVVSLASLLSPKNPQLDSLITSFALTCELRCEEGLGHFRLSSNIIEGVARRCASSLID